MSLNFNFIDTIDDKFNLDFSITFSYQSDLIWFEIHKMMKHNIFSKQSNKHNNRLLFL